MQKCFLDAFNQKILVLQNILGREADFFALVQKIDGETHREPLHLSSCHHLHYKCLVELLLVANIATSIEITRSLL